MSSFDVLLGLAASGLSLALVGLVLAGGCVLIAQHYRNVHGFLTQVFGSVQAIAQRIVQQGLAPVVSRIGDGVDAARREATLGGKHPLAKAALVIAVVLPLVAIATLAEIRMIAQFWDSLFPEQIELPFGTITGGLLLALLYFVLASLIGLALEALLGVLPLPHVDVAGWWELHRARCVALGVALAVAWLGLVLTVVDMRNEVYDALGRSTCAERTADMTLDGAAPMPEGAEDLAGFDGPAPAVAAAAAQGDAAAAAAQERCEAAWQANGRARSIQVVPAVVAMHLSAIFIGVTIPALALLALVVFGVGAVASGAPLSRAAPPSGAWDL